MKSDQTKAIYSNVLRSMYHIMRMNLPHCQHQVLMPIGTVPVCASLYHRRFSAVALLLCCQVHRCIHRPAASLIGPLKSSLISARCDQQITVPASPASISIDALSVGTCRAVASHTAHTAVCIVPTRIYDLSYETSYIYLYRYRTLRSRLPQAVCSSHERDGVKRRT